MMNIQSYSILSYVLLTFSLATSSVLVTNHDNFLHCLNHITADSTSMSTVNYFITPQNTSFESVLEFSINNLRFVSPSTPKPLAVVKPVRDSEIQNAIYCSKKHDIEMRIRGGGNDYEGISSVSQSPFIILDMSNYRMISVDPVDATAWVQSGATLGEVYYNIGQKSKTLGFPGGIWSNVGVTGLTGGGGYGTLRRKYGLAADNVIDAYLMDVNGVILDRKSMGEDLFWAIRGGGVSSFGVILSWKLQLVPVPEIVTVLNVARTLEQNATEILYRWQTVAPKLPNDVEIRVVANRFMNGRSESNGVKTVLGVGEEDSRTTDTSTIQLRFVGLFLGKAGSVVSLMDKEFPELNLKPQDCREVSYVQSAMMFSLFSADDSPEVLLNRTSFKINFKAKSDFVDTPMSREAISGIWKMILQAETGTTNFIFTAYGGKMDEISESETPFPHRAGTLYMMYMRVLTDRDTEKAMNWIRSLSNYLTPYVTKSPRRSYVNYNDLDLGVNNPQGPTTSKQASQWGRRYFGNNFDRLVKVKSMVDPGNFFRHQQSIPPF